ncbi:hypothetical protein HRbin06_00502 [archaeon HR06]|nr:hypothetical protein HRbin06_00502 [archaeon HR06]
MVEVIKAQTFLPLTFKIRKSKDKVLRKIPPIIDGVPKNKEIKKRASKSKK